MVLTPIHRLPALGTITIAFSYLASLDRASGRQAPDSAAASVLERTRTWLPESQAQLLKAEPGQPGMRVRPEQTRWERAQSPSTLLLPTFWAWEE